MILLLAIGVMGMDLLEVCTELYYYIIIAY
jgi:hypothetical protein